VQKPTYEELADLVVELRAHIVVLDARIAELERQMASTSRNSSKPPSSDGLGKPNPKSFRKKSGRKPGGQGGHLGKTLEQVADPDEVIRYEPARCGGCGAGLARATEVDIARRQVFDLPPITIRVTEHELVSRLCSCVGGSDRSCSPAGRSSSRYLTSERRNDPHSCRESHFSAGQGRSNQVPAVGSDR